MKMDSITITSEYTVYKWNVTSAVQEAISDKILTLVLTSDYGEDYVNFMGKEGHILGEEPYIAVHYEVKKEPVDLFSIVLGGILLFGILGAVGFGAYKLIGRGKKSD